MRERPVQRLHMALPVSPCFSHEFLNSLTHFKRGRSMRHWFAVVNRDRPRKVSRPFPNKPTFLEAEYAAPNSIERHRDNRCFHILHDALKTTAEGHHLANTRDLSLGENANHITVSNGITGRLERFQHFPRPLLGRNWNDAQHPRKRLDPARLVMRLIHHKTHVPIG